MSPHVESITAEWDKDKKLFPQQITGPSFLGWAHSATGRPVWGAAGWGGGWGHRAPEPCTRWPAAAAAAPRRTGRPATTPRTAWRPSGRRWSCRAADLWQQNRDSAVGNTVIWFGVIFFFSVRQKKKLNQFRPSSTVTKNFGQLVKHLNVCNDKHCHTTKLY